MQSISLYGVHAASESPVPNQRLSRIEAEIWDLDYLELSNSVTGKK